MVVAIVVAATVRRQGESGATQAQYEAERTQDGDFQWELHKNFLQKL